MRFLTDVNASGILASWLQTLGHDVVRAAERNPRMLDEDILTWAVEEHRIIVTTDQDFEEMIWREGKPHEGVLRLENLPREERKALLCDVMTHHSSDLSSGAIVIAMSNKIRIRNW
ncbi:MAG: DUF5615 family PIN-like protein [Chloroflexota bacterium]|nr:DUF5615 family PIN-like protein [Chloroflexota bacterium]